MLALNTILQGRYRIIRKLGEGGMGVVYEAIDERLNSLVAIKETIIEDEEMRRAFQREAGLLANLRHSCLPTVRDHVAEGNEQYIVMEYISGNDLARLLEFRGCAFAQEEVLRWGGAILKVLEYLHKFNPPILHRDIKPSNLKLTEQGELFLLDFGLAKGAVGQMPTIGISRSVQGYTRIYAPLEQIHGVGTDPRSDLYSLGATLYHLMTGVQPIDAPTRYDALENERSDPLRPAYEVNSKVTPEISEILSRAMAVSRRERIASAAEMREALEEVHRRLVEPNQLNKTVLPPTIKKLPPISQSKGSNTLSQTKQLQLEYWTALDEFLRKDNSSVKLKSPSADYSITGFLSPPQVELVATANTRDSRICVGVWFYNRKDVFRALEQEKEAIEQEIGWHDPSKNQDFLWLENKEKSVSDIWLRWKGVNIYQREQWPEYLEWHKDTLEKFYKTFEPRVRRIVSPTPDSNATWHKFVSGESYKTHEVVGVCLQHITSGKVVNPEEKFEKLGLIEGSGHPVIVYAPRGDGWAESPMNPNSWETPDGHPILEKREPSSKYQGSVQIDEPVVAITINQQFPYVRNDEDLYNATRGIWRVSLPRANKAKYAFAVYKGVVKEVYEIDRWIPAQKETLDYWAEREKAQGKYFPPEVHEGRSEFIGKLAPEKIREKYVGQQMPVPSTQNPIRYINCDSGQEGSKSSIKAAAKYRTSESVISSGGKEELVERFWDGFNSRFDALDSKVKLNKPYIPSGGGGKSWRNKVIGLSGFNLAAQINASKNYADVNITAGRKLYDLFYELHSQRDQIEKEMGKSLEWKLNPEGESWVIVRRAFDFAKRDTWDETYKWLFENLELFYKAFERRIDALNH